MLGILALDAAADRAIPALYVWMSAGRMVYWYRQLKALERSLDSGGARYDPGVLQAEFDRIDTHVRRIRVPMLLFQRALRSCAGISISCASDWR